MNGFEPEEFREVLDEFLFESREMLREVESTLMELEQARLGGRTPERESVDAVFRAFHSVKGTSGFLGFDHMVAVTHRAESLLDLVRKNEAELSESLVTAVCDALDFASDALSVIERSQSDEATAARAALVSEQLEAALDEARRAPVSPKRAGASATAPAPAAFAAIAPAAPAPEAPATEEISVTMLNPIIRSAPPAPEVAVAHPAAALAPLVADSLPDDADDDAPEEAPQGAPRRQTAKAERPAEESRQAVRVDVDKLDALMNIVGELILAETMVTHNDALHALDADLEGFHKASLHLSRVTRTVQDIAMTMRMSPIRGTFRKMLRVVRDLSQKLGKSVDLQLSGEDTEVDRNLVEAIADPLVHILRNCMDHGIETPAERVAAGKDATGCVVLSARHQGGEVWITIQDDGRGLHRDRILDRARKQGLVDGTGDAMPDAAVWELLFAPGFSTAVTVTDVSGRGVGMDVVRRNIAAVNGTVQLSGRPGQGMTVTLRIPLTLAIIDGMLIQVGPTFYALPLPAIRESYAGRSAVRTAMPGGGDFVQLRDEFLPLVRLADLHGLPSASADEDSILIVLDTGTRPVALVVDRIIGQRQTVVKALPAYIGTLPGVSGCSILSNGDISLILDPRTLLETARWAA
jgi:two-component system chemotaxis sensor kinase CheA